MSDDRMLAEEHYRTGLQQVLLLGDQCAIAEGLEQLGIVSASGGNSVRASKLFAAGDALRRQIGAPLPPIDRERVANGIALSRMALDSARFEAAWAYGEAQARVGLQQVVTMALDDS